MHQNSASQMSQLVGSIYLKQGCCHFLEMTKNVVMEEQVVELPQLHYELFYSLQQDSDWSD